MSKLTVEDQIRNTVFEFIKDLKDNVFIESVEQGEFSLVEFWFKKLSSRDIADHIVKHVLPHADKIKKRNLTFFIQEKESIFKGLPKERITYYTSRITSPPENEGISMEEKNCLWTYFDILVELTFKYRKNK